MNDVDPNIKRCPQSTNNQGTGKRYFVGFSIGSSNLEFLIFSSASFADRRRRAPPFLLQ